MSRQYNEEAAREVAATWALFERDPPRPNSPVLPQLRRNWTRFLHRGVHSIFRRKHFDSVRSRLGFLLQAVQSLESDLGRGDQLSRNRRYHPRADSCRYHRRLDWSEMGHHSRCCDVHWNSDVDCHVGPFAQWLGYLLCLFSVGLWRGDRRRVSDGEHYRDGRSPWTRHDAFGQTPSWAKCRSCFLDAGQYLEQSFQGTFILTTLLIAGAGHQPSCFDPATPDLPWRWQPTIQRDVRTVDIPRLIRLHSSVLALLNIHPCLQAPQC